MNMGCFEYNDVEIKAPYKLPRVTTFRDCSDHRMDVTVLMMATSIHTVCNLNVQCTYQS